MHMHMDMGMRVCPCIQKVLVGLTYATHTTCVGLTCATHTTWCMCMHLGHAFRLYVLFDELGSLRDCQVHFHAYSHMRMSVCMLHTSTSGSLWDCQTYSTCEGCGNEGRGFVATKGWDAQTRFAYVTL